MKTQTNKMLLITTVVLLLIPVGYYTCLTGHRQPADLQNTLPVRMISNDSVFWSTTSDILRISNTEYEISHSPIFGLPDARNLYSFGNCSIYTSTFSIYPQHYDKGFNITWTLRQDKLVITQISFIYPEKEVKKRYPDAASRFKPISEANKKFWLKQNPDTLLSDADSWKYAAYLYADWYTGTLYAKKRESNWADFEKTDEEVKKGFPVLKLFFQNGVLKKQEELLQFKKESNLPPPPNPFETDTNAVVAP